MSTTNKYNEENIRLAAYYNWQNAGCPNGKDEYFWNQAVKQLYGSCKCSSSKKSSTSTKSCSTKSTSSSISKSTSAKKTTSSKK